MMHAREVTLIALLALVLVVCGARAWASEDEEGATTAVEQAEEQGDTAEDAEPTYRGDEEQAMPLFERAERAFDEHDYDEAVRLLEEAFELHEHPLIAYNIGVANGRAQHHEAAIAAYQRYLQICPRSDLITEVYISIGECLLRLRRREEANEAFQHYLDLERDGGYAAQAERAIRTGETPADQDRRDPRTVQQAQELFDRAEALADERQFQQAAELFLRGYERMPDMHELLFDAGLCYLDGQMWADGARTLSRYVRTPGADPLALYFLGEGYGMECDFSSAVEALERYLQLAPDGAFVEEARAFINDLYPPPSELGVRRETGATPGEYNRAREHYDRGDEHFEAERYREAISEYESAFEIVPSRQLIFFIGRCYSRLEEWQQALTQFERVLERGDQSFFSIAHVEAAECLIELNRPQDAIRHLDQYLARAREDDFAEEEEYTSRADELRQRAAGGAGGQ
jgi:tetratricopeptide (TPR) repeat protein